MASRPLRARATTVSSGAEGQLQALTQRCKPGAQSATHRLQPTLFMIQALQIARRVAQYAIARPSREICFTVVEQSSRYKAKNVIDTVIYRFGDVSSAWVQAGLRSMGYGLNGAIVVGVGASLAWFAVAAFLGGRYEKIRVPETVRRHSSLGKAARTLPAL